MNVIDNLIEFSNKNYKEFKEEIVKHLTKGLNKDDHALIDDIIDYSIKRKIPESVKKYTK